MFSINVSSVKKWQIREKKIIEKYKDKEKMREIRRKKRKEGEND